jgi:hypothetical protein
MFAYYLKLTLGQQTLAKLSSLEKVPSKWRYVVMALVRLLLKEAMAIAF